MDFSNLQLSSHFIDNYIERVGIMPEKKHVIRTLNNSLEVQTGQWLTKNGEEFNTLSIYVNFHEGLAILIDNMKPDPVAVSIRSKNQVKGSKKKRSKNYIELTRHKLGGIHG